MNQNEMEAYRPLLLKFQRRLAGEIDTLKDEAFHQSDGPGVDNLSNIPVEDRAERASDNYCEETTLGLAEVASDELAEIGAALERIDDAAFGICEDCGGEVSKVRLQSVPFARRCVACASKAQQGKAVPPGNL